MSDPRSLLPQVLVKFLFTVPGMILSGLVLSLLLFIAWRFYFRSVGQDTLRVGFASSQISPALKTAYHGFMIEYLKQLGSRMRCRVTIAPVTPKRYIDDLASKKLDLIVLDKEDFSDAHDGLDIIPCRVSEYNSLTLIFWDKVPYQVASLNDYAHYSHNSTGAIAGSYESEFLAKYPEIEVKTVNSLHELIVDLKLGTVRAALVSYDQVNQLESRYGLLKILPVPLDSHGVVMFDEKLAVSRDKQRLRDEINRRIDQMSKDKTIARLHRKWFAPELISRS